MMTFQDILKTAEATLVHDAGNTSDDIKVCCSSDLMSDILTLDRKENAVLVTGLANTQAIRTAEMADLHHIVIVRQKKITEDMVELARESGITLASTALTMFAVCGRLYEKKLQPPY